MMEDKLTKVTIFYDPDGDVYAFSENKNLVMLFENTRRLKGYIKKKVTMNEYQYRAFLQFNQNHMMFLNVLTDGEKSFDYVTTYQENDTLDKRCDDIYNRLMKLEYLLFPIPFEEEVRKKLADLVAARKSKEGKFGKYNTFEIFVDLFKDSIL